MKKQLFSLIKYFFGWPLSLIAIAYLFYSVTSNLPLIMQKVTSVQPLLMLAGVLSFLVYFFIRAYSWQEILKAFGYKTEFPQANYLWGKSEARRYVPGNVWSFLSRAFLFSEIGVPKKETSKGLILEAELIVIGSCIVSLLALPFIFANVIHLGNLTALVTNGILVLFVIGVSVYIFQKQILSLIGLGNQKIIQVVFPSFPARTMAQLVGLSVLSFFFFGLGYFLVAGSVISLHPQKILELTGFFALSYILGYLSLITPSGLGVREGAISFGLLSLVNIEVGNFIALITRFILTLAEGIYLGIAYVFYSVKYPLIGKTIKLFNTKLPEIILCSGIVLFSLYYSLASVARYDNFYTGKFDLGNMAQTVWNTAHGNIFQLTDPNGVENASRLGTHADFILVFFAPFYFLWEDPRVLLVVQAVVVGLGAIFVYNIAEKILKSKMFALTFGLLFLLNPSVGRSVLYDFHAVVLATTFLLGAYYFLIKKRYMWFAVFAILAAITKEQIWLIIALFGGYLAVVQKKWLWGIGIFIVGTILTFYFVSYAIPKYSTGTHFALTYYSEYGDSTFDVVKNIFLSPVKTIQTVLLPERIEYFKQLLMPLGYYSLFFPLALIFLGPDLTIYTLSNNPNLHQIYYQYTATLTPFIFIAAIYSVSYLWKIAPRIPKEAHLVTLVAISLYGIYQYGPLPGSKNPNLDMFLRPMPEREKVTDIIHRIPEQYSVAATNNAGSHLSHRREIFTLPNGVGKADVVVFLRDTKATEFALDQQELIAKISTDAAYLKQLDDPQIIMFKKSSK